MYNKNLKLFSVASDDETAKRGAEERTDGQHHDLSSHAEKPHALHRTKQATLRKYIAKIDFYTIKGIYKTHYILVYNIYIIKESLILVFNFGL